MAGFGAPITGRFWAPHDSGKALDHKQVIHRLFNPVGVVEQERFTKFHFNPFPLPIARETVLGIGF
jgi:hypothetical protein